MKWAFQAALVLGGTGFGTHALAQEGTFCLQFHAFNKETKKLFSSAACTMYQRMRPGHVRWQCLGAGKKKAVQVEYQANPARSYSGKTFVLYSLRQKTKSGKVVSDALGMPEYKRNPSSITIYNWETSKPELHHNKVSLTAKDGAKYGLEVSVAAGACTQTKGAKIAMPTLEQHFSGDKSVRRVGEWNDYDNRKVLVRRVVDPEKKTIQEYRSIAGRGTTVMTFMQTKGGEFTVSGQGGSVKGTAKFEGVEWRWEDWTYELALMNGSGTLKGRAAGSSARMSFTERFFSQQGKEIFEVKMQLYPIPKQSYDRQLKKF